MGSIKDRNGIDLTEAVDIKKGWQEYTEELYKKDLHDPDNHDGVFTHLEPDILECEVSSVTQSCPTLCNPMNCSMPGFPVHHQLPEFTQTHIHRVTDAIQPSHPLLSPSSPAPYPSQHQSLFQ